MLGSCDEFTVHMPICTFVRQDLSAMQGLLCCITFLLLTKSQRHGSMHSELGPESCSNEGFDLGCLTI